MIRLGLHRLRRLLTLSLAVTATLTAGCATCLPTIRAVRDPIGLASRPVALPGGYLLDGVMLYVRCKP